jgi:dienelactone hydrolase
MRTLLPLVFAAACWAQTSPTPIQPEWEGVPEHYRSLRFPEIEIPATSAAWEAGKPEIRAILREKLGDVPPRPTAPKVRVVFRERRDGYVRERVEIDNGLDGIPAWLVIPDDAKKPAPAILCLHWHSSDKNGPLFSDQGQNVLAPLAERGYVLLSIDSAFNGERLGRGPAGDAEVDIGRQRDTLFKLNLWFGRTLWGMMVRDTQLAVDYLASRPEVDPQRLGVQGMSMGGTGAWWLGALDERVKAVVTVACFTRYRELITTRWLSAHAIYYFVPGLLQHFDSEAILGLIAPRPLLALTGDRDTTSPPQGVRALEQRLERIYGLYGAKDRFRSVLYEDTGHEYTPAMKREMAAWFDKWL